MNYGDVMYLINIFLARYFINILKACIDYYVLIKKTTYFRSNIFLGNQLNFKVNDKHFSVINNRNMFLKPL